MAAEIQHPNMTEHLDQSSFTVLRGALALWWTTACSGTSPTWCTMTSWHFHAHLGLSLGPSFRSIWKVAMIYFTVRYPGNDDAFSYVCSVEQSAQRTWNRQSSGEVARLCACTCVTWGGPSARNSECRCGTGMVVRLCGWPGAWLKTTVCQPHNHNGGSSRGALEVMAGAFFALCSPDPFFLSVWHDPMGRGGVSESWCRVVPLQDSTQRSKLLTTQHNSSALVMLWISSGILNLLFREKHWHFCDTGHGIMFGQVIQ